MNNLNNDAQFPSVCTLMEVFGQKRYGCEVAYLKKPKVRSG